MLHRIAETWGRRALRTQPVRSAAAWLLDEAAYRADCAWSLLGAGRAPGAHAVAVYFHGVLPEPDDGEVDPQERITPGFLRRFIRAMKRAGYTFVTPAALVEVGRSRERLALLTSDDGYRSVERLLPLLREEEVPLTVFLTSEASRTDAVYWWDQLYIAGRSGPGVRARLKGVRSRAERDAALLELGLEPSARARSESHRLLSPGDVARLAGHESLYFGNHTRHHLSLPLLSDAALRDEIETARRDLETWSGRHICDVAFPYGDYDERVLRLLAGWGYRAAFTTAPGHFPLPGRGGMGRLHLVPRYRLRGDRSAAWQSRVSARGVTTGTRLQQGLSRWLRRYRGGVPGPQPTGGLHA